MCQVLCDITLTRQNAFAGLLELVYADVCGHQSHAHLDLMEWPLRVAATVKNLLNSCIHTFRHPSSANGMVAVLQRGDFRHTRGAQVEQYGRLQMLHCSMCSLESGPLASGATWWCTQFMTRAANTTGSMKHRITP